MAEKPKADEVHFTWPCLLGFYWELLLDLKKGRRYECGICGLVARQVVELICPEHSNDSDSDSDDEEASSKRMKVYCLTCLESYLKSHNNLCPIGNHKNAKYQKAATIDRDVLRLKVKCPRALQQTQKATYVLVPHTQATYNHNATTKISL